MVAKSKPGTSGTKNRACTTLAPTVQANYVEVGDSQRCAEAALLLPTTRQRMLIGANPTAEECYTGCSLEVDLTTPFYFSLSQSGGTTQCYCCQTCTPVRRKLLCRCYGERS